MSKPHHTKSEDYCSQSLEDNHQTHRDQLRQDHWQNSHLQQHRCGFLWVSVIRKADRDQREDANKAYKGIWVMPLDLSVFSMRTICSESPGPSKNSFSEES